MKIYFLFVKPRYSKAILEKQVMKLLLDIEMFRWQLANLLPILSMPGFWMHKLYATIMNNWIYLPFSVAIDIFRIFAMFEKSTKHMIFIEDDVQFVHYCTGVKFISQLQREIWPTNENLMLFYILHSIFPLHTTTLSLVLWLSGK